jgi:hypothetical protein
MFNIQKLSTSHLNSLLKLYAHLHADDAPLPAREQVEKVWREILSNDRFQYFGGYIDD